VLTEIWVPGRIEFLGKHTDYAGGRSLLCPVDRGIRLTATPRGDSLVRVTDTTLGETVECEMSPSVKQPRGQWANYPFTVVRRLARDFPDARTGVDIEFTSDLPIAAGMSSSSALVVAVYMAVAAVNDLEQKKAYRANIQTPENLAEYLGCIEGGFPFHGFAGDEGVGTLSGCEDQTAMICGRAGSLVRYSFCPVRFEGAYPMPADQAFIIAASGELAEKTSSALEKYNSLSRKAAAAAEAWRRASGLNDKTIGEAIANSDTATVRAAIATTRVGGYTIDELLTRFDQFHAESEVIIPAVGEALARNDLASLGALVDESQRGAERLLGNQIPETIDLAASARELGATAASAFGAGFGGSVWAMVASTDADEFLNAWRDRYLQRFPQHASAARFFVTRAGGPAARLS
jgi:galactokinase